MRNCGIVMRKKLAYVTFFVLMLVLSAGVSAEDFFWDRGGAGPLWSMPANWDPDGVPGSEDGAQINIPDASCLIDASVNATCGFLYVGYNTGPCYLDMTGGSLTLGGHLRIGDPSSATGIFKLSGGVVDTGGGRLWIGMNGTGTVIMTGGVMTAADKLEIGKNSSGTGWLYIEGGTLNIAGAGSDDLEIAKYGTGTLHMTGGEVNVTDNIKLGQNGGTGRINLYGGTFNNGNDDPIISDTSMIDITEGTLVLTGDATLPINEHVANGRIMAYGGNGRVEIEYDDGEDVTRVTAAMIDAELAWSPGPANLAVVARTAGGPVLTWKAGKYGVSHDVYFGTSWDDVNDANNTPGMWPEYKGNQDPCSFDPGPLELGRTYYWRIDEVNDNAWVPPGSPWKGVVWEFTIAEYLVVEDFEDYNDYPPDRVFDKWADGWGVLENGSTIGYPEFGPDGHFLETSIFHGGGQSAPLGYDNSTAVYSEATVNTADLPIGTDWSMGGPKALSLWFYGDPENAATERLYVKLNGVKVTYDGELDGLKEAAWQEWGIDLASFGEDLKSITSLAIGLERTGASGGLGSILIDDVRLYGSRCIPSLRQPVGDLDDDCDVDFDDLSILAGDWLERDYVNGGSDGISHNFPNDDSQWVDDAGRVLQFDGVDDWVDINDSEMSDFHDKTISLWVKIRAYTEPYPYVFCFQNAGDAPYRIYIRTRGENIVRARLVEDYLEDFSIGTDVWGHVAVVLRDTDDGKCTGEFYGNGELVSELPGLPRHSGGATGVNIGSFSDGSSGFLNGVYDDFRIYDHALSANEIGYLAGLPGGTEPAGDMLVYYKFDEVSGLIAANSSTYVFDRPVLSEADLYKGELEGSRRVNFKDFALLAETWFEEQLWP
ncbi:MAG: hypothetical protein JSU94_06765 [Phycisphaerales bacterium]|nr:MAG: hypothetical protein JSU94_06765 [Phycisphaerales bacterium]